VFRSALIILFCTLFSGLALAQEEEDEEYQSEFVYGINFNTNGGIIGGAMIKYARAMGPNMYQTFGLEIVNVKHPKELRAQSNLTGNTFIYGKQNYLFVIRPSYGRELVLFRKAPDEGVQINAIAAAGPSIGLVKPYYILYAYSPQDVRSEPYNPDRHNDFNRVSGSGGLTEGFDQMNITMGLHAKLGMSFELSGFRNSVTGFEVGFLAEAYTKKIIIIPAAQNRSVFSSVYLTLFFGSKR
jgi:hypothetical protein